MIDINKFKIDKNNKEYEDGYRIVYFYENGNYDIGEYCKTIEGFMIGFSEFDPIISDEDIPKFVSNKDLLSRCLSYDKNAIKAAIYKTDGTLIEIINKEKNKHL